MPYQFAYLVADLMLLAVWLALFLARKDLRQKMLVVSTLMGFVGPLSELWYHIDYWKPEIFLGKGIGIEDYVFGFTMSGIASVIYQAVFNKKALEPEDKAYDKKIVLAVALAGIILFNALMFGFRLNSIYASSFGMIIVALAIIYVRKDLFMNSFISGILMSASFFLEYMVMLRMYPELFHRWWFLANLSGIFIVGVPLEELLWAFALGMLMGPMYEFLTHRFSPSGARIQ